MNSKGKLPKCLSDMILKFSVCPFLCQYLASDKIVREELFVYNNESILRQALLQATNLLLKIVKINCSFKRIILQVESLIYFLFYQHSSWYFSCNFPASRSMVLTVKLSSNTTDYQSLLFEKADVLPSLEQKIKVEKYRLI